jgi:hypothetical protein
MYPRTFVLLQQEGFLIKGCLTHGLTALRHARVDKKDDVYSAFIQLSIGFERMMKVTLIVDHMARHHFQPPPYKTIKSYGHDLLRIFGKLADIAVDDSDRPLDGVDKNSVEWQMFEYLSHFANTTRYFNLDELGAGKTIADPLAQWKAIVERIVKEDVPRSRLNKAIAEGALIWSSFVEHSVVLAHDAYGQPMDLSNAIAQPLLDDLAAPYAVWHMILLLKRIDALLHEVNRFADDVARRDGRTDQPVPTMWEFFTFLYHDRAKCLATKRWP